MDKNSIDILNFWFKEIKPKQWFDKNSNFDNLIYSKFYDLHYKAINGELNYWKNTLKESLAFIILIDQFSRNMFRENRLSFDYDYLALEFCNYGLMNKYLEEFNNFYEKLFFIMPLIHHEDFNSQTKAKLKKRLKPFSFVPTMGGLHKGHKFLIEKTSAGIKVINHAEAQNFAMAPQYSEKM